MTFRMLETREYGGSVAMPATEPESLDAARIELLDTMHCWEEEALCASWTDATSWWLWECAHQPVAADTRRWCWGCDDPTDDERAELRRLADAAGGWWVWLHHPTESFRPASCPCDECSAVGPTEPTYNGHSGLRFVPLDVWRAAVALNDDVAARAMLAEHLAAPVIEERRTSVQGTLGRDASGRGPWKIPPGTITWSEHLEVYEAYAKKWGRYQSAERMAERGGFAKDEAEMLLGRPLTTWKART